MTGIKIALALMSIAILCTNIAVASISKVVRKLVEIITSPCVEVEVDADEQRE